MPKVSIIIPFYNGTQFLDNVVNCLKNQTFIDFEAIFVDDGSVDDSFQKCYDLIQSDNRMYLIHQENKGVSAARNKGIDQATGNFICFADVDDFFTRDYINDLYCESDGADLVIQGRYRITEEKEDLISVPTSGKFDLSIDSDSFFRLIDIERFGGPYCKLFDSLILKNNNILFCENLSLGEDFDFLVRYLSFCKVVVLSSNVNYSYIFNAGSLTSRLYSFDCEYFGLKQLDKSLVHLCSSFHSTSLEKIYNKSISYRVYRCISSVFNEKFQSDRYFYLKKLYTEYCETYKSFVPKAFYIKIQKYLFCHGFLYLMDLLHRCRKIFGCLSYE